MTTDRADRLRDDVCAAIADLSRIRDDDPAAVPARLAVKLTIHTLEHLWIPALASPDD